MIGLLSQPKTGRDNNKITSGLVSLLLDLMLACCNKSEDGTCGWNETILHEWVSIGKQQEEDPNIQTQRVERSNDGIEEDDSTRTTSL